MPTSASLVSASKVGSWMLPSADWCWGSDPFRAVRSRSGVEVLEEAEPSMRGGVLGSAVVAASVALSVGLS